MDTHEAFRARSYRMRSFMQDHSDTPFSLASQLTSDVVAELNEAMMVLLERKGDCFHKADAHLETALEIALTYYCKRQIKSSRTGRDDVVLSNAYLSSWVSDTYATRACLNDHMQNLALSKTLAETAIHFNARSWSGYWRLAVAYHRLGNKADANLALLGCFKAVMHLDYTNEFECSEARMFRRLEQRRVHCLMRECDYWFDKRVLTANVHFQVNALKHGLNKCVVVDTHGAGHFHTIAQALQHHREDEQLTILLVPGLHFGPVAIAEPARQFQRTIEIVGMQTPYHGVPVVESTEHSKANRHEEGGYTHTHTAFEVDEEERSIRDCVAFLSLFVKNPEADESGRLDITRTMGADEILSMELEEDLYSEAVLQSIGEPVLVFGQEGGLMGAAPDQKEETKLACPPPSSSSSLSSSSSSSPSTPLLIPVKVFLWRLTLKRLPAFRLRSSDNATHKPGAFVIRASEHPSFFSDLSKADCVVLMRDTRESLIVSIDGVRILSPDLGAFGVHAWGPGPRSRFPLTLLNCEFDMGLGAVRAFQGGSVVLQNCRIEHQTACVVQISHGSAARLEGVVVVDCGGATDAVEDIGVHFGSELWLVRVAITQSGGEKFINNYHFLSERRAEIEERERKRGEEDDADDDGSA